MSGLDGYIAFAKRVLPTPFTIAILLSALTYLLVLVFTHPSADIGYPYALEVVRYWENGVWQPSLMAFTVQMMLILVLGHSLALAPFFEKFIGVFLRHCNTTARAAAIVAFFTILVGLFNWGLGLIFGAVFARKVGERAAKNNIELNYPLIGAAGYATMATWHGGLSGSSLVKVAEQGHLKNLMANSLEPSFMAQLPDQIPLLTTVFSGMNLFGTLAMALLVPMVLFLLGKRLLPSKLPNLSMEPVKGQMTDGLKGAEKIDHSTLVSKVTGAAILAYILLKIFVIEQISVLECFTPDNINLLLFSLCLLMHRNFIGFLASVDEAVAGAAGILIQFPLYYGIMGMISESGLITLISDFFIQVSTETTYPFFTFISAGLVNLFVPSGGGQWVVQGPIVVKSAMELDIPLEKCILALAYGDQLTNMLQPFWALPLLGITRLSAREILPYTLFVFLIGLVVYSLTLFLF